MLFEGPRPIGRFLLTTSAGGAGSKTWTNPKLLKSGPSSENYSALGGVRAGLDKTETVQFGIFRHRN